MKVEVLDLAKADLIQGYHYYEQKEAGLGIVLSRYALCGH